MKHILSIILIISLMCSITFSHADELQNQYKDYYYVGMHMQSRAVTEKIVQMGRNEFPSSDVVIPVIAYMPCTDEEDENTDIVFRIYVYSVENNQLCNTEYSEHRGRMNFGYDENGFCVKSFNKKKLKNISISEDEWNQKLDDMLEEYFMNCDNHLGIETEEESSSLSMSFQ